MREGQRRQRRRTAGTAALAAVAAGAVAACGSPHRPAASAPTAHSVAPLAVEVAFGTVRRLPAVAPTAVTALGRDDLAFGVDLLHQMCRQKPNTNVLLSPTSISGALDLAYAGARGRTATQLGAVLHQPAYGPVLEAALASRRTALAPLAGQVQGYDTIWADKGFGLLPGYLDAVRTAQGAGVHRTDFAADPEVGRHAVNADVAAHTGGLIPDLLPKGSVDNLTRAVLTDTLHLDARWDTPMDPNATHPAPFRTVSRSVSVPTMQTESALVGHAGGLTAAELTYTGGRLRLLAVLPGSTHGGCSTVTATGLAAARAHLGSTQGDVLLPRLDLALNVGLTQPLTTLGIGDAFDSHRADFTGMTGESVYLSSVQHQTVMRVGEKGTVAAAATAGVVEGTSARVPVLTVALNRPFALELLDRTTGAPLFLGWVADPAQG